VMRIHRAPVEDRIETYAAWIVENGQPDFLIGYVNRSEHASWTTRLRGDPQITTVPGRKTRGDTGRYLLVSGAFAQEHQSGRRIAASALG
jgi:hypothetical protein